MNISKLTAHLISWCLNTDKRGKQNKNVKKKQEPKIKKDKKEQVSYFYNNYTESYIKINDDGEEGYNYLFFNLKEQLNFSYTYIYFYSDPYIDFFNKQLKIWQLNKKHV